MFSSFPKFKMK